MRSSGWKRGDNKPGFSPEREFRTDNPQPTGPRPKVEESANIYIVLIRDLHPCGMVLLTAHEL